MAHYHLHFYDEFKEEEHPRGKGQRFVKKGTGSISSAPTPSGTVKSQYFKGPDVEAAIEDARQQGSRSTIINLSPSQFLDLAEPGHSATKEERIKSLYKEHGHFNTLPYLYINEHGQVTSHEGRHRLWELRRQGVKSVPVILRSANIRWGQSEYHKKIPKKLISQGGGSIESIKKFDKETQELLMRSKTQIPMPDSLIYPRKKA